MHIDHLKEFVRLAQQLNFTKTACDLNISQSTLSKHIYTLESELKTELFDRKQPQVTLTESGRIFIAEACALVFHHDEIVAKIRDLRQSYDSLTLGGAHFNPIARELIEAAASPDKGGLNVLPEYVTPLKRPIYKALADGDFDIAFAIHDEESSLDDHSSFFSSQFLFAEPLVVIVGKTHPLAKERNIHFSSLDGSTALFPTGPFVSSRADAVTSMFKRYSITMRFRTYFTEQVLKPPAFDYDQDVFLIEQSVIKVNPIPDDCVILTFIEEDICFKMHAIYKTENSNPMVVPFVERLVEAALYRRRK